MARTGQFRYGQAFPGKCPPCDHGDGTLDMNVDLQVSSSQKPAKMRAHQFFHTVEMDLDGSHSQGLGPTAFSLGDSLQTRPGSSCL